MQKHTFDVVVIGSGTSAYYAIDGLNQTGNYKVAVVDERPYGGTCALRGCQPKKYLVSNAETIALFSHLNGQGVTGTIQTDWKALQKLKNEFLHGRSDADVKQWQKKGVATFHGRAQLTGTNEVQVGENLLQADKIILATGALPRLTDIPGKEFIKNSEAFLDLDELPERILFIGGGYISFEFSHVAAFAGSREVTLLHRSAQPLKAFDPDIVSSVMEASKENGINILTNTSPTSIIATSNGYEVHTSTGEIHLTDLVIEATGRIPNLTSLEGDLGNVAHTPRGVTVNEYLQSTTNPAVYAIGDCAATSAMLATVADKEGQTVVRNILEGNSHRIDYSVLPSAVFTIPSIGSVGLREDEARESGKDIRVNKGTTINWPSSKRIGEKHSAYKVIIDNTTDLILGAHIARHNASEVINIFGLAIQFKIKAADLKDFMWAYPTYTSDLKYMVS